MVHAQSRSLIPDPMKFIFDLIRAIFFFVTGLGLLIYLGFCEWQDARKKPKAEREEEL